MYVHGSAERLMQGAGGDKIDGLEAASVSKIGRRKFCMVSI